MHDSALNDPICDVEGESLIELRSWVYWRAEHADLADRIEELEAELAGVKEDRDALEIEVRSQRVKVDEQVFDVMRAVREWFDDVVLFGRRRDTTQLRRRVDDIVVAGL